MNEIKKQILKHEGLRLKPYKCTAGKLTIGVGRNLEDNGISEKEAMLMLHNDLMVVLADLNQFDWFLALDEIRQRVVIDMRFNLGPKGFREFKKMIKALKNKDYEKAAEEMINSKWYTQVNVRSKTLVKMMLTGRVEYD